MAEKSESARTTVILALCAVLLGVYVLSFGLQTLIAFQTRRWAHASPFLNAVPQPLPTSAASAVQVKNLSAYGWGFAAPWKGQAKQTENADTSKFEFSSGEIAVFFNPSAETDTVGGIRTGDPQVYNQYQEIFGAAFFPNNYALYQAAYGAAPAETSPFMARSEAVRINTLLIWKLKLGIYGENSIYSVQTNTTHGFQLGDPSRDRAVIAQLFDENDHQIRIVFSSRSGQPGTIPQADINCVIDSLEPAPVRR